MLIIFFTNMWFVFRKTLFRCSTGHLSMSFQYGTDHIPENKGNPYTSGNYPDWLSPTYFKNFGDRVPFRHDKSPQTRMRKFQMSPIFFGKYVICCYFTRNVTHTNSRKCPQTRFAWFDAFLISLYVFSRFSLKTTRPPHDLNKHKFEQKVAMVSFNTVW